MRRKKMTINFNKLIFVVLIFSFFCIAIKTGLIALRKETDGINLTKFVENRNTETRTIKASRGSIYSIDGEKLAQSVNSYTIIAYLTPKRTTDENNPQHVVDKEMTAQKLSEILGADKAYLLKLLNKKAYQTELGPNGRGLSELVKKQIEELDLPGIDFIESQKRLYPMSTFASYIIGYAQTNDDGDIEGKMGVEAYYDDELQGKDGYTVYQKDAYGYTIPNTNPITVNAEAGKDIYLTIDSKIQLFVENAIKEISEKNKMDWMTFSIIDANTGAVVASSSNPTFNLNTKNIKSYLNPLTSYSYEPGSTMKIFSFLASMENNKYNGNEKYKSGTIKVDDAIIKDFNGKGWGVITYDEGFAYSSNVAATKLALNLGRDKLHSYYSSLGFGQKTGMTLPGEYDGQIDFNYKVELATASFGQGITTTPIQNLQALTILTNNGIELQPYIVEKIVDSETGKISYEHKRKELGQKASPENIKKIMSLMYDVVYSGKTDAKFYKASNVTLVGKTGTAQITGSNGQYMSGAYDYIRSFAGVFPYENPQYIIYVSVKRYTGNYREFAKTITNVVEEVAKYKNITELTEKIDNSKIITLDNYISTDATETENKLKKLSLNVITIGNGKYIINQYPLKGNKVLVGNKVFLLTNDKEYKMPDITSWSRNEVITFCNLIKLKYKIEGYGIVKTYDIAKDTILTSDMELEVTLDK